ncbi:hypothetical protein GCM10010270_14890 [Streptomyces violaceus]|nr:hypothetical protein GCM10010270_14890 [Streptomyces janthinus]
MLSVASGALGGERRSRWRAALSETSGRPVCRRRLPAGGSARADAARPPRQALRGKGSALARERRSPARGRGAFCPLTGTPPARLGRLSLGDAALPCEHRSPARRVLSSHRDAARPPQPALRGRAALSRASTALSLPLAPS